MNRFLLLPLFAWAISCNLLGAESVGIQFLEKRVASDPDDFIAWNQLGDRYLAALRDGGEDGLLAKAENAARLSLKAIPERDNPGGVSLQARVALAGHRFSEAKKLAEQLVRRFKDKDSYRLILSDALIELGEDAEAEAILQGLAEREYSPPDVEARWGRLELMRGRIDRARERFEAGLAACEQLGRPAPNAVAWFHVMNGEMAFRRGDFLDAASRYDAAMVTDPGNLGAAEHSAELLGAEGKLDDAIQAFRKLADAHGKPGFFQALGDLFTMKKDQASAAEWHRRAIEAYEGSVRAGEVRYIHHLAGLYADSVPQPAKAVEYARRDLELRKTPQAWDALAWALYKNGELAEAREAMRKALGNGSEDAHLL